MSFSERLNGSLVGLLEMSVSTVNVTLTNASASLPSSPPALCTSQQPLSSFGPNCFFGFLGGFLPQSGIKNEAMLLKTSRDTEAHYVSPWARRPRIRSDAALTTRGCLVVSKQQHNQSQRLRCRNFLINKQKKYILMFLCLRKISHFKIKIIDIWETHSQFDHRCCLLLPLLL